MPGLLRKSTLLGAGIALLAGSTPALLGSSAAFADTIVLRGAHVLTMDEAKPDAAAIALVDGKIAAVGTADDMKPFLEGAKIYEFPAEALVLPGFQDGHNHLIWSATEAENINLTDVADKQALRAAIEPALAALPEGAWARGGGWSVAVYKDPHKSLLDDRSAKVTTSPSRSTV